MRPLLAALLFVCAAAGPVHAIIFHSTGDPSFNTAAPTGQFAGSGWQYQGTWGAFLGTPVAPNYFVTAEHIGGSIGQSFTFRGIDYTTTALFDDPETDLRIWQVAETFTDYAPLYTRNNESGRDLVVLGRGTQRGAEVRGGAGELHGWLWGAADSVQRWGTNQVSGVANGGSGSGELLTADFNAIGGTEAHLSVGDSGGGVFIRDPSDSLWKLAGINYAVSGPYYTSITGAGQFNAALSEEGGFFVAGGLGAFLPAQGPGQFFATRISSRADFILAIVPEPGALFLLLAGAVYLLQRPWRRVRSFSNFTSQNC